MNYCFLIIIFTFLPFSSAHAYIDPGFGVLFQSILAGIALGIGYLSMQWARIKNFFFRDNKKKDKKED